MLNERIYQYAEFGKFRPGSTLSHMRKIEVEMMSNIVGIVML